MIWAKQIEDDPQLKERLLAMSPGAVIELEVGGICGRWAKANAGRDGRPTNAIKPVGTMKEVWKDFQLRRGSYVSVHEIRFADTYLASLNSTLSEWNSPEDDEAFRDL
jgi:hypothetical protein